MPLPKRTTDDLNHLIEQYKRKRMHQSIQIYIVVEPRYRSQAQPTGLMRSLEMQGFPVTVVNPNKARGRLCEDTQCLNLAIIRGRSRDLLALVSKLEAQGIRTINGSDAISSVRNKANMAVALEKAGVPTPATYYEPVQILARRLPQSAYPLILKPVFGDNARGLRIVSSAEELAVLDWPEPLALAQRYVMNDRYDLKLYGIGDEVWAVRKPSPLFNHQRLEHQTERVPLTPDLRNLGQRCGALFGLELYGVDCILTPSGPVVIEVNDFPNYTGVAKVNNRLADYVIHSLRN